jgi:hypothetical protein
LKLLSVAGGGLDEDLASLPPRGSRMQDYPPPDPGQISRPETAYKGRTPHTGRRKVSLISKPSQASLAGLEEDWYDLFSSFPALGTQFKVFIMKRMNVCFLGCFFFF